MQDWIERFVTHIGTERRLSPLTVDGYRREIARFSQRLVDLDVNDWRAVDESRVRDYIARRAASSGSSTNRTISHPGSMSSVFS